MKVCIICIVTLFLAEYCGFGWVVGTFVWIFWFCFRIRLKILYFHYLKVRWKIFRKISKRTFKKWKHNIFKPLRKKIKISNKSSNYQPNPQYQPKKRHYLYNIWWKICISQRKSADQDRQPLQPGIIGGKYPIDGEKNEISTNKVISTISAKKTSLST